MKRRIVATALALMIVCSFAISTTTMARASYYIARTTAGLSSSTTGKVSVSYSVAATRTMPVVGVDSLCVEVNYGNGWGYYDTFEASDYPSLLGYNKSSHAGTFTFDGVSGARFQVCVNSYASDANGHDYSYVETPVITCK